MALDRVTKKKRKLSGRATIEVACGLVFILVLSLLAVDVIILLVGYEFNDRACHDACVAAAQQTTAEAAKTAASTCLSTHKADGNYVADPILLTDAGDFRYQNFAFAAVNPSVTVTTECKVKTPVPLTFFSSLLGQHHPSNNDASWTFRKRHTMPIVTNTAHRLDADSK